MTTSPQKISIICPSCGYEQQEYAEASATACHSCGQYIPIKQNRETFSKTTAIRIRHKRAPRQDLRCKHCGHMQNVPADATSWQCMSCGSYLDLKNHEILHGTTSKIITYGGLVIGPKGSFLGPRAEARWMRLSGSASGLLVAEETITIESGIVRLRNRATGQHLEVLDGARLETDQLLEFKSAMIAGQVKAKNINLTEALIIQATGTVEAENITFNTLKVMEGGRLKAKGKSI